jgi:hypothetical protein
MAYDPGNGTRNLGLIIIAGILLIVAMNVYNWYDVRTTHEKVMVHKRAAR